jgi:cysteine desulfurase
MHERIYLDHQATTPLDPRVRAAMLPWLGDRFGHPESTHHAFGWDAEKALEQARAQVADLIQAEPKEILFTSGGAEADSLAVRGVMEALHTKGRHLVTSAVERSTIRDVAALLVSRGWEQTVVEVDPRGRVEPEAVRGAIRDDTVLVSIQTANQEIGTLQPVAEIGAICREKDVLFHTDATAAAAWLPLSVEALGAHLVSLTGHLMHGPMGIGALYVKRRRPRVPITPLIHGGGAKRRGGTPNLPGAVGLGVAAELCRRERESDAERIGALRDRLEAALEEKAGGIDRLGDVARRLPNVSALTVEGAEGEALVLGVPRVAMATGSACTSRTLEPSYVLRAIGLDKRRGDTSVRFGLGRFTTEAEVEEGATLIVDAIERIRAMRA